MEVCLGKLTLNKFQRFDWIVLRWQPHHQSSLYCVSYPIENSNGLSNSLRKINVINIDFALVTKTKEKLRLKIGLYTVSMTE